MKNIIKIFLLGVLGISIFSTGTVSFAENIEGLGSVTASKTTDTLNKSGNDIAGNVQSITWEIIDIVRYVFSAVLLVFIVYAGVQMIMSRGTNEEDLSKAKRTFWYCLIGIFFINFPIVIYNMFIGEGTSGSLLFQTQGLVDIIQAIINFLEIVIAGIAIFMIVLVGIRLITSRGREERVTEAKNKILWVVIALVFIGFIEVWRNLLVGSNVGSGSVSGGDLDVSDGIAIFESIANLALYLAGPIALLFLTLAGFYYITSNGDDERAKRGRTIIINTILGVIILLCAYVLLNDLSLLTI